MPITCCPLLPVPGPYSASSYSGVWLSFPHRVRDRAVSRASFIIRPGAGCSHKVRAGEAARSHHPAQNTPLCDRVAACSLWLRALGVMMPAVMVEGTWVP